MKSNKPSEMTDQELIKYESMVKVITISLGVMLLLLFACGLYITFTKGFSALQVIPLALFPILIININSLNTIKKEKKSRNL